MTGRQRSGRYRVLLLADSLQAGGAERQLTLLAEHLPPDWERRLWSLDAGPFLSALRSAGVPTIVSARARAWDPRPAAGLWRLILRWRPDVVHSWGWMCTAAVGPLCKLLRIPLVDSTIRAGYVPPRRAALNRSSLRWAARIVANSQGGLRAWGISERRGRVIHNGFDPHRLPLCEPLPGVPLRRPIAVMTGRMSWEKDFDLFLLAARRLSSAGDSAWRFIAVGDGPDRERLLKQNEDLTASGAVEFHRPGLEVLPIVRLAGIGVLLSHPRHLEGISNSIMEYMACALPTICSDSGGNRELVVDGVTGSIIPPADPEKFVDALSWLQAHGDEAFAMGLRARDRLLTHFSVQRMVESVLAIYREVVE